MNNISVFDTCYGCGVCSVACAHKAINISLDQDGFIKPVVNNMLCTECGVCLKVCAFYNKLMVDDPREVYGYAGYSKDDTVRKACSSGGVGYELARHAIENEFTVCAVRYDVEQCCAVHYFATSAAELNSSRGSKYIQSHTVDAFSHFKRGPHYMVIGTPCQIDSLRRYVRMKRMDDKFVLVDFFCHGVPSNLLWQKYLKEFSISNPTEIRWRDKQTGWHDSWNMVFKNESTESSSRMSQGDLFYKFYLKNRCLGKPCYDDCKYKMASSAADIRIGDLWGTKYQTDENGISGILTFTKKGDDIIHRLSSCTIIPETISVITESQMKDCAHRPSSYKYVANALRTDISLSIIDKKASRIERIKDVIPSRIKHYSKRIVDKLLCK